MLSITSIFPKVNACKKELHLYTLLLNFILLSFISQAQRPTNFGQGSNSPTPVSDEVIDGPDSTVYEYLLTDNIFEKYTLKDSLANTKFLHRNTMQLSGHEIINTGNFGSATFPLIYSPKISTGFNTGYNQYKTYQLNLENFRFFEQNRPIADLYFSQLGNQENINVGANFSRNFSDGLSVSLNYNRISQKGFYNGQDTKSTAFGFGLRYKSPGEKYNAFLIFMHNANEEGHIGGIIDPEDLNDQFKKDIPVILNEASTRQQERNLSFIQYYKLNSTTNKTWRIYLKNEFKYIPSYFRFSDVKINNKNDSTFYGGIPIDPRGIRRYLDITQLSNGFYINGERIKGVQGRLGLILDHYTINNIPTDSKRTDVTATFDGKIPFYKSLLLETNAKLGLLKNLGNFDLKGKLNLNISKIATLQGNIRLFRSEPAYNSTQLNINEIIVLDTSFVKPVGTIFNAEISVPNIKFSAGITQSLITNPVYWNNQSQPVQYDGLFTATYIRLAQNVKAGPFHLDNQLHFQILNPKIYPTPSLYSTHQLYYAGTWFNKVMDVNIGIDTRLIADYDGPLFQPLYGEFILSTTTLPFFPAANFYLLSRVSSFRVMIIMENFGQYFRKDYNFDVLNHPQFDPKLRFGIQWLLKD